jgi:hypothetical protein
VRLPRSFDNEKKNKEAAASLFFNAVATLDKALFVPDASLLKMRLASVAALIAFSLFIIKDEPLLIGIIILRRFRFFFPAQVVKVLYELTVMPSVFLIQNILMRLNMAGDNRICQRRGRCMVFVAEQPDNLFQVLMRFRADIHGVSLSYPLLSTISFNVFLY